MKSSRGHYRPLFGVGVGRSPPFLAAALTIGLCILAVSYWRLALQYNDLEEQLKRLVQKRDSLEANQSFINKQLEIREENFSEAKVSLQKKEQEVDDLKKKQDQTGKELAEIKTSLDSIKSINDKLKLEATQKEHSLALLRSQNTALEGDKSKLESEVKEVKAKLANLTSSLKQQSSQPQSGQLNANIPKPDSAAKDPVYNLLNAAAGKTQGEAKEDLAPVAAAVAAAPLPKPSNTNSNQIVPPPEQSPANRQPKSSPDLEEKMKVAESRQNVDILDPANLPIDDDDDAVGGGAQGGDVNGDLEIPAPKKTLDNPVNNNYEVENNGQRNGNVGRIKPKLEDMVNSVINLN